MSQFSILIVDDEENICFLIGQWLKPLGHTVQLAHSGAEALNLAAAHRFDLVVTDIVMPDCDGLKLMESLRQSQPAARILAISGGGRYMDGAEYLKLAQGLGVDAAVAKPFMRDQFLAAVDSVMAPKPA